MYAIGKIGCFVVGCCYGIEYNGLGNIVYTHSLDAPNHIHLFPVQILETIVFLLIFIYMLNKHFKNKFSWQVLGIIFILSGLAKFILDFFRYSHINQILSVNQLISVVFIIIGIYIYINQRLEKRRN
jgi:phosphatidylglycerol:prolipoprotein diacylglycerol transferase